MATITIRPNGAGDVTGLQATSPAGGTHYAYVSDQSDSTVVVGNVGQSDLYNVANTAVTGVISQIEVFVRARTGIPGATNTFYITVKTGNSSLQTVSVYASYTNFSYVWSVNPNTGSAWTWSDINNLQVGITVVSGNVLVAAEEWVVVTYNPVSAPTIVTGSASPIGSSTATLGGNITDTGGENNTVRGFQYGLTDSYGSDVHETGSYGTGAYTLGISGLLYNTTYHFRAYSTNSAGTSYGSDQTFTTLPIKRPMVLFRLGLS